jgi:hypothetical protein
MTVVEVVCDVAGLFEMKSVSLYSMACQGFADFPKFPGRRNDPLDYIPGRNTTFGTF